MLTKLWPRLPTAHLNQWLRKVSIHFLSNPFLPQLKLLFDYKHLSPCMPFFVQVMSRHSWKDQSTQPKINYFTQVKAWPRTFIVKEDFDIGIILIRIMQRTVERKLGSRSSRSIDLDSVGITVERKFLHKRTVIQFLQLHPLLWDKVVYFCISYTFGRTFLTSVNYLCIAVTVILLWSSVLAMVYFLVDFIQEKQKQSKL